jgi:hypothetical protein
MVTEQHRDSYCAWKRPLLLEITEEGLASIPEAHILSDLLTIASLRMTFTLFFDPESSSLLCAVSPGRRLEPFVMDIEEGIIIGRIS